MEDTTTRVEALLSDFDYRTAQISRRNRVRNLKARTELLQHAAEQLSKYAQSDWMFALHGLETKKLREFLVFEDWADAKLMDAAEELHFPPGQMPAEHLYKRLDAQPRHYNELECLWISALNRFNMFGQEPHVRPEKVLKSVGIQPGGMVWPAQFEATFWDPAYSLDSSYLDAIVSSEAVQEISRRVARMNNTLWLDVADGCLQIFLPFQP